MRILTIGNIYGYFDQFITLLKEAKYNPCKDKLFILGELIDFGPKSIEVVEECIKLQQQGAVILRGKREQLYIDAILKKHHLSEEELCHTKNNILFWYDDHPLVKMRHLEFFKNLKLYAKYKNFFFSHTEIDEKKIESGNVFIFGDNPFSKNINENKIGINFGGEEKQALGLLDISNKKYWTICC